MKINMIKEIKVSIIIPVYNVEAYLTECLLSAINQTLEDIEIICINDGSTDKSLEILKNYALQEKRMTIINSELNKGQSFARNKGIEKAQGLFIYFLDSDDILVENAMENLYVNAINKNLDGIFFDSYSIYENNRLERKFEGNPWKHKKKYSDLYTGSELFSLFVQNQDMISAACLQFWRREYLNGKNLKFYEGIIHEDILFTFLALLGAERVSCIDKSYYYYRHREGSTITKKISDKHLRGYFYCYYEMNKFWKDSFFNKEVNLAIEKHIEQMYLSIKKIYRQIAEKPLDIEKVISDNIFIQHIFKVVIADEILGYSYCCLNETHIDRLKSNKKIIIYGAGNVAKEVLQFFDKYEIGIYKFAVSNLADNPRYIMGTQVCEIETLVQYKEDSIVVVALTQKFHKSILMNLERLGFADVLLAT